MNEQVLKLIEQNPILLICIVIVVGAIIGVGIISLIQGRSFKSLLFEFGPKSKKEEPQVLTAALPSNNIQQPTIQNVINISPEVTKYVTDKVEEIKKESGGKLPDLFYQPPEISDRLIYICSLKYDLRNRLAGLVLSVGGGWAGCSIAELDTYLEYASMLQLIPDSLKEEINKLISYVYPYTYLDYIDDNTFLQIEYLASSIILNLNQAVFLSSPRRIDFGKNTTASE